jgi:Ca2+-binding EF-hand superfamily protein
MVTAPDASFAEPIELPAAYTAEDLIQDIKDKLKSRGAFGIRGVARVFKILDDGRDRQIDAKDFQWGLVDYGISITEQEAKMLIKKFDRDNNGTLNFDEFLVALRGDINKFREGLIRLAYGKLDINGDGQVTLDDIAKIYNASHHPDVIARKKTEDEVFLEFMSQWDTQVADGIVTFDEFMIYFKDVSASIDTDEYFEAMMKSAWKL